MWRSADCAARAAQKLTSTRSSDALSRSQLGRRALAATALGGHLRRFFCVRVAAALPQLPPAALRRLRPASTRTDMWQLAAAIAAATAAAAAASKSGYTASCEGDDLSHELYADEQRTVALFERCSASVVHINTFVEGMVRTRGLHFDLQEIPAGTGSGFLWDHEHVVTNFHVIKDADRATIVLADGTSCEATLVGVEPDCDLAVLRIKSAEGRNLVPLERGRSSNLHVGQRVFAIGNPFGLDQTLTNGIVSGLGREMRGVTGRTIRGLVQTDAAINPGNSGGPLLDARGRLIGVNTMIASPSGAFAGVGFAIPVDNVVRVVQQLVKWGHTKHAYLGVFLAPDHIKQQVSRQLRHQNIVGIEGALVVNVEPGSPAESAGLKPTYQTRRGLVFGDEILAVSGKVVSTVEQLLDVVESHGIGDSVEVRFRRRSGADDPGEVRTAKVRLSERPGRFQHQSGTLSPSGYNGGPVGGNFAISEPGGSRPRH